MKPRTIACALADAGQALANCQRSGNTAWEARWRERIREITALLPSGSGVDNGTEIVSIDPDKLDPDARSFIRRRARELIGAVPVFAVIVEHECEREYEFDSAEREPDVDPAKVN